MRDKWSWWWRDDAMGRIIMASFRQKRSVWTFRDPSQQLLVSLVFTASLSLTAGWGSTTCHIKPHKSPFSQHVWEVKAFRTRTRVGSSTLHFCLAIIWAYSADILKLFQFFFHGSVKHTTCCWEFPEFLSGTGVFSSVWTPNPSYQVGFKLRPHQSSRHMHEFLFKQL